MKKMLSFLLAAVMLVSAVPTAFAADTQDYSQGTQVVFEAANNESYTITVPAKLNPGQSGTVTLDGSWPSNKTVSVTAEPTVTLTNSILASDQKVLDVTFLGISEAGSDIAAQTFTETVSVAGISDALFGTWNGKFNYNVDVTNATNQFNTPLKFGERYTAKSGTWIFRENGQVELYNDEAYANGIPSDTSTARYSNKRISFGDGNDMYMSVSDDGLTLTAYLISDGIEAQYIYMGDTVDGPDAPVLNEYGFYFNEFYGTIATFVFHENGAVDLFANGKLVPEMSWPAGSWTYENNAIIDPDGYIMNISSDGKTIIDPESSNFILTLEQ